MKRNGLALIECVLSVVVVVVMLACLLPISRRSRLAGGLDCSMNNVRLIVAAEGVYKAVNNQVPMRANHYYEGAISGWDSCSFGGKDCSPWWISGYGGDFDESAYSRQLNAYLYPDLGLAVPSGYFNNGIWPGWTFWHGTASVAERDQLELPVYRSPGDVDTRQRNWPTPTPGISCYDDVGTSYLLNMKWWDVPGLPTNWTAHYNEGVRRIRDTAPGDFVWVNDEVADVVANLQSASIPGQFGGTNMSVAGFIDGSSGYIQITPGAMSGPGYTFDPSGTPLLPPARRLWIAHP
jgi:hypothetical protein